MTQLQMAIQGIASPEILAVAESENIDPQKLMKLIASGEVVIPHNRNRNAVPTGIGSQTSTKVNANIGSSDIMCNLELEIAKIRICEEYGAHSVMDLSTGGDLDSIRKVMLEESRLILGTVPIYAVASKLDRQGKSILDFSPEMLFTEIERQAEQGVDFMTVHAGITKWSLQAHDMRDRASGHREQRRLAVEALDAKH
jgi:phosphomethylpyrimidine synthase